MKLQDLPQDVVLLIGNLVEPDDFDAWLATCRDVYAASQTRLKHHQELKDRYSVCVLKDDHPATLLYAIWEDAWVARYVKTLDFTSHGFWEDTGTGTEYEMGFHQVDSVTCSNILECKDELLTSVPQTFFELSMFHSEDFALGDETPSLGLLLLLLTNLQVLRLRRPIWNAHDIRVLIRKINAQAIDLRGEPSACERYAPLSKLHTMEMDMSQLEDEPAGADLLPFVIFNDLPSLRKISGVGIGDDDTLAGLAQSWDAEKLGFMESALKHIHISQANMHRNNTWKLLYKLLEKVPHLVSFRFSLNARIPSSIDISTIANDLASRPFHMRMEHLSLSSDTPSRDGIVSLRAYDSLKTLEIDAHALIDLSRGWYHRVFSGKKSCLADWLPLSIETLSINLAGLHQGDVDTLFKCFSDEKLNPNLPKLRKVSYAGGLLRLNTIKELIDVCHVTLEELDEWVPEHDQSWIPGVEDEVP